MRGPVEQLGCARRPVKAEVAGSNPVGTALADRRPLAASGARGQVAQSVERAAENRKVGGSIPSLPTGHIDTVEDRGQPRDRRRSRWQDRGRERSRRRIDL